MSDALKLRDFDPDCCMTLPVHSVTRAKFPVFDAHTHFGSLVMGKNYRERYDTKDVVARLKQYGVVHVCNPELSWDDTLRALDEKLASEKGFISTLPSLDVGRFEKPGFPAYVKRTLAAYEAAGYRGIKLWKDITLYRKDSQGRHIRLDDPRLNPVFELAGKHNLVILIHVADPRAFFTPPDAHNEYYECLQDNPNWVFSGSEFCSFAEHMRMQETVFGRNPGTKFLVAHVGSCAEDMGYVGGLLERFPNVYIDIAARINELGRQPRQARELFLRWQDRVLFGTDFIASDDPADVYPYYFRFLETFDEYFDYAPKGQQYSMGRWKIYGVGLPDDVLQKLYHLNAEALFGVRVCR